MSRRFATVVLALVAFAAPQTARYPSVLLITLDTTRADRMGFLGSKLGLTPAMDAIARDSIVFTRAYAQAPITTVSHATILSGTYPPFHHVNDFGAALPASVPYVPALLKPHGYRTVAFVGSLILDPRNGAAPGFDRGFDVYDAGFRLRRPGESRYHTLERRGAEVTARALRWLDQPRREPFFLWVHLYDPHDPYDPPAGWNTRFRSAYDAEIAAIDGLVGQLAKAAGPDALVVVAADHGEALGDHGEATHGVFLYDATLHVPLLVRLPGARNRGMRVNARVRLADVAPTMLEAVGLPVPAAMQGESLLKLTATPTTAGSRSGPAAPGATRADRPVYAETEYPRRAFGWSPLVSWRADRFLFVRAPRPELYDLDSDPGASANVAGARSRVVDGIDAELAQFIRTIGGNETGGSKVAIEPALAARLAALGYVSGSSAPPASGVDPKDKIAVANILHDAVVAVESGSFARAIPLLEKVIATEPHIHIAQLQLGVARAQQRRYAEAIPALRKAIELQPDVMLGHYELGVALYETGDLKTSAAHFEIVASRMPQWADARYSLGSVYARIDRVPDAVRELRAAIDLEPRHFRANLLLGRIATLRGDAQAALSLLRTAVDVDPSSSEAHTFLADAYDRVGNGAGAAKERQRALDLKGRKSGPA